MAEEPFTPKSPLDAFLEVFWKDVEADGIRPLADYQARFPGDDGAIASEYRAFREAGSKGTRETAGSSAPADYIAHYRILRQIGRGAQGTVYLAEDAHLHRQVALKVIDPGLTTDNTAFERFRREAEITSRLDHPGICTVYETGEDQGVLWIAMRYVEGESLAKKIWTAKERQASSFSTSFVDLTGREAREDAQPGSQTDPSSGPKTWTEIARVLALFEQAARALHVAHEHGVVHRDIKPGNLIVTNDGDPVILDFGLAQEVEGEHPTLTATGSLPGTPAYMSPEQLMAYGVRLDRRTDVYSLGVSLYECLTLRRPFDAPTRERLYQAILTKDPPDVRALNPSVPKDLKVVLETALEKDRERRYHTALDLAEELRRVRGHEPILAKPVGPLVRLQRWAQRNPALSVAVAGLFAVLTIGLGVALFLLSQRDRALREKETALGAVTTERDAKNAALTQVTTERNEKQAALSDYDSLGDMPRLQRLVAEADALWPAVPSKVAAMTAWVEQGADLEKRLAGHREVRDRLRASPGLLPYTKEDRAADLKTHAVDHEELARLRAERERVAASLAAAESRAHDPRAESRAVTKVGPASRPSSHSSPEEIRPALAMLDEDIAALEARVHERLTWKFDSTTKQFKHDTTAKLVADLTAFVHPNPKKGLLADVRARLAFAETVERETIGKYEIEWAKAIGSIADKNECPKYGGLKIVPQLGLIPIGQDPTSGLWEFAHLQTTAPGTDPIPKRDADGRLVVTESMGLVFVLLPGGTFSMGAMKPPDEDTAPTEPNIDVEANGNESPVTSVTLDPFFLSKYEMTQGLWLRLVGRNPSQYGPGREFGGKVVDLRNPVEQVSWEDCDVWLWRLGLGLPTEAQWEYGARGGTTTPRWTGIGTDGLGHAANLADAFCKHNRGPPNWKYESWNDGYTVHAPVGSFAANPFGLHDVLGNVWEWCGDWFGGYGVNPRAGDGLRSPPAARNRVARGGGFSTDASYARSAFRYDAAPVGRDDSLGLRPARPCRHD